MPNTIETSRVRRVPISTRIVDVDCGYVGTKRGVEFQVVVGGTVVWEKQVAQNWVSLSEHRLPFYAHRLARAERKAKKVAYALR